MATKKSTKKKPKSTNGCLPTTIILLVLVTLSLTATFYFLFLRPWPGLVPPTAARNQGKIPSPPQNTIISPPPTPPAPPPIAAKTAPPVEEKVPADNVVPPEPKKIKDDRPRIAIIIDDIGNTKTVAEQIIALDLSLSFSIIPHTPYSVHLAGLVNSRGRDLLIHIPMEPTEAKMSVAPGMLLLSMTKETLINTIHHDLDTPYRIIGVNNHMGSKFSQNADAMRVFLKEIKTRNLFFIDSLTSAKSTGYAIAHDLGIKSAKRDIFLDNDQNPTQILAQIGRLIKLAQRNGSAIGIGHPHPATLEALRASQTRLSQDIVMVPIHELVH